MVDQKSSVASTPGPAVRKSAAAGLVWNYLTFAVSKGAVVVASIVLARLLLPQDFGLLTLGLLCINYLSSVQDVGVGAAIVHHRRDDARTRSTAFVLTGLVTVTLAAAAFACAPLAGSFFDAPRLPSVVRALAVALLVSGLATVPRAVLQRRLDFRRRMVPEVVGAVTKSALSIGLALAGLGVWGLVWGQVAGALVTTIAYFLVSGWRPRLGWDAAFARSCVRYGLPVTAVGMLAVAIGNVDYLVIGHRLGDVALGFYLVAYRLPELIVLSFLTVASQVLFPALSRLRDDPARLRAGFVDAMRHVTLFTTLTGGLLACAAPDLVVGVFSASWLPAVDAARLLGVYMVLYAFSFHAGDVYKAAGRPWILTCTGVAQVVVLLPLLWYASRWGITGVAAGMVVFAVVAVPTKLGIVVRLTGLRVRDLVRAAWPSLAGGAALALTMVALDHALPHFAPLVRGASLCLAGVAAFAIALRFAAPGTFAGLRRLVLDQRGAVSA